MPYQIVFSRNFLQETLEVTPCDRCTSATWVSVNINNRCQSVCAVRHLHIEEPSGMLPALAAALIKVTRNYIIFVRKFTYNSWKLSQQTHSLFEEVRWSSEHLRFLTSRAQVNLVRHCVLGLSIQALDTLAQRTQVGDQTWLLEVVIRLAETANIMESWHQQKMKKMRQLSSMTPLGAG